jgi:hypothetical protein
MIVILFRILNVDPLFISVIFKIIILYLCDIYNQKRT